MNSILESLNVDDKRRVEAIAQELAKFGLGVFFPHAHDPEGKIVPLPAGIISYENNLRVSFIPEISAPSDSIPVGWRWSDGTMRVCARCCYNPPAG